MLFQRQILQYGFFGNFRPSYRSAFFLLALKAPAIKTAPAPRNAPRTFSPASSHEQCRPGISALCASSAAAISAHSTSVATNPFPAPRSVRRRAGKQQRAFDEIHADMRQLAQPHMQPRLRRAGEKPRQPPRDGQAQRRRLLPRLSGEKEDDAQPEDGGKVMERLSISGH